MPKRRVLIIQIFAIFGLLGLSLISCSANYHLSPSPRGEKTMKLASSAFVDNGLIPTKYTCDGANISPPLSWDEIPPSTQSLVLIVDDSDAPVKTFVHWVVYNIPSTLYQLPEQIPAIKTLTNGAVQGKNDFGNFGYGGPCPPSGTHRYFFQLYALDKTLSLASGAGKSQIISAMQYHVLAQAELIGRYQRQR
ncbi:YbhB/YbcL family Raf kinase inhibitor-like protein [Sphaerospermopsis aphanizomenoides BCCUSP55]|uniref:YbhB/YbcL family Raf kinase inhibitor-like protein n=1 Tax=Sphaerospermopsis aphanizomenoides TaxID=459663 RepID=UPI00190780A7|nr:YbhB/YbcL family Raf kinase inhibitor-like protein [Sphaerospermopsis aphanizomenoides]MBK1986191.1 YbhB/YbcL family Raf kinase inhibitor-like protein [Sphaerospermopsis aphanizomenoides BCCUSP55]